jgi:hypothetical protein
MPYIVVAMLPYFDVHFARLSATATAPPMRPPSRLMPRGNIVMMGSVDSGQSMVRPGHDSELVVVPQHTGAGVGERRGGKHHDCRGHSAAQASRFDMVHPPGCVVAPVSHQFH